MFTLSFVLNSEKKEKKVVLPTYSEFLEQVKKDEIKSVTIVDKLRGTREIEYVTNKDEKHKILAPADEGLMAILNASKVNTKAEKEDEGNLLLNIFISWFPMVLLITVWIYFMRKSMGGKGGIFGLSKNKSKLIAPNDISVSFADVVGCEEVKLEVQEVVEFLKNKNKFSKLGGKIPNGILLTGSAGVGKTLLGKAIAKEAGVPFFSMSGSSFVEMFVGLGSARVRDLFAEAKKVTPCIIFIDEIDAIGGKRSGSALGGGETEREQTLNQLLVEMDGIDSVDGIVIIGATNRPDGLDPALLRPGRLDRHIYVPLPDVKGREQILNVHINLKNVPISLDLDMEKVAKSTSGFSGAELENLVNEAAIIAARKSKSFVDQEDFEMANDKIIMGPERKSMAMPEKEKINTAYHEAGHTLVAKLINHSDPLHKVTIIPRGKALGVTMQIPQEDKYAYDKEYFLSRIAVLMGGRIGEEVFLNHMTTGASNDILVATNIANKMVKEWGMSKLGMIAYGEQLGGAWANQTTMQNLSQETIREVDLEVRKIIQAQYDVARKLIEKNKEKVEVMAKALLELETLDDWQIDNIINGKSYLVKEVKEEELVSI